jgi:ATP-dependent DNA ligase
MCGLSRATTSRLTILHCLILSSFWPWSRLSLMARSSRSMRKAGLPFSCFRFTKAPSNACRLFITFSIFSLWMGKICLRNRFRPCRRKLLPDILKKAPPDIRLSEGLQGSKEDLLRVAQEFGLEGLVAKRLSSVYESGRRSGAWVKVKLTKDQEFVIGGYTFPEGSRRYFGSLPVGYNSPEGLRFAGRVGTGFSEKLLASVDAQLQKLKRPTCPFINLPEKTRGRWGQGITPAVMKRCQWVKPVLVAQVKFTEWTLDDQLRQPVFLGLRTDKEPKHVVRE